MSKGAIPLPPRSWNFAAGAPSFAIFETWDSTTVRILGSWDLTNDVRKRKRPSRFLSTAFILCRQRPTLPHTFACSTIGPAGLNFRVRDGNGWNPRGKITDKSHLSAISRQLSATCAAPTFRTDAQQT